MGQEPLWTTRPIAGGGKAWPKPSGNAADHKPLAGVKVIDFSRVIAAPAISKKLAVLGADVIRISHSKNPDYAADKYVEPLVGPDTVTSMPHPTLDAYREHGTPSLTLRQGLAEAHDVLNRLEALGIGIDEATQRLEDEGVEKFVKPFGSLMATLAKARDEATAEVAAEADR